MDTVNVNTDQPINRNDVVILDDGSTVTASVGEVVINSSESTGSETIGLLPEVEYYQPENPAGDILKAGMTLALVVSQVDGPLPGPADAAAVALAGATLLTAAVVHVGYEIYQFAQHGKNRGTISQQELEVLRAKEKAGTLSGVEKQKLKRHQKNTGERRSRQSRDKK